MDDPELSAEAARIRDRARDMRLDAKRHGLAPKWSLVQDMIANPLHELRDTVAEELIRRSSENDQLVPIDRDPVPNGFSELVRKYYEALGSGE